MDFNNKCRYARAFVVLLAALIALLLNIKYERELVHSLIIVIIVIIVFFIISTIAIRLIDKIRNMDVSVKDGDDDSTDEEDDVADDDKSSNTVAEK